MYKPVKNAGHLDILVRKLRYRVNTWGDEQAEPVFLLHGWMDLGMSFQALADVMSPDWYLIAPDWRGFGDSQWQEQGYWFPDYYADLDVLINYFSPDKPVRLVGHSMGGHVVWSYSGIFPERVSHAISLDAFGMSDTTPDQAPARYRQWLEQVQQPPSFSSYDDISQIERHIKRLSRHIPDSYVSFVAEHWSMRNDKGELRLKADPAHKRVNPVLYRREEARSCWSGITAKTALILGQESDVYRKYYQEGFREDCQACFRDLQESTVESAGHMLHWERVEKLSELLESFLKS